MSSTSKIRDGLAARERAKNPDAISLSNLVGAPSSVSDLQTLAGRVLDTRTRLLDRVSSVDKAIRDFREKRAAEIDEMRKVREPKDNGTSLVSFRWDENTSKSMLEKDVNAYAKAARKTAGDAVAADYATIRDTMAKVRATRDSLADPTAILMRTTRTDPAIAAERATAAAILAHSGAREVEAALQDSVLQKRPGLAAAALSRMDAMDDSARKSVRLSRGDVAGALVGAEATKAQRYLAALDIAEIDSDVAWATHNGRDVAQLMVRRGLKERELQHLLAEEPNDD